MKETTPVLNGAFVLTTPSFGDDRGSFSVTYERSQAEALGLAKPFVQDNHSISAPVHTLRGIHLQLPPYAQGKLVRVLRGRILDVVVDLRPGSPTRGEHAAVELAAGTGEQLWVPAGFGHAFCTLEPDTEVFYKVDAAYAPEHERSLAWDDPTLGIAWPAGMTQPVLSAKDAAGSDLATILAEIDAATAASTDGAATATEAGVGR
ncbi:MAG: dTDP-4-dehydrorhamnose 3,5-epimerase [Actinomycetota bacterium]